MNSNEIENGIIQIYKNDPNLAKIIDITGPCKLTTKRNYYHSLLRSIIGQQLSIIVAEVIWQRFLNYFIKQPNPEDILSTHDAELRKLGLSTAKIIYIKGLSLKILKKQIKLEGISKKNDTEIIEHLTKVKGIGVWTVHMFLIFTLGRLNILPVNDLGLKKATKITYKLRKLPDEKKLILISLKNGWEPYNSIASWYLWKSLEI